MVSVLCLPLHIHFNNNPCWLEKTNQEKTDISLNVLEQTQSHQTAIKLDNSSASQSSPTSESSFTLSREIPLSEDTSEYSFIQDLPYPNLPPPPMSTATPPSPQAQTITLPCCTMQLENIPEFSGTQEDSTQLMKFLKMVKQSLLANIATMDEQKINIF
jgi:hypothetical protein